MSGKRPHGLGQTFFEVHRKRGTGWLERGFVCEHFVFRRSSNLEISIVMLFIIFCHFLQDYRALRTKLNSHKFFGICNRLRNAQPRLSKRDDQAFFLNNPDTLSIAFFHP